MDHDQDIGEIQSLYRRSDTLGELFAALAKAQAKIVGAEKDGKGNFGKYATLGTVIEASREPLAENGLAVVQMPGNYGSSVAVTTLLGHSSGEWIESILYVAPGKFDAQGVGSVITYLRRYARMAVCGIAPEDDDGEAAVSKPDTIAPKPRPAPKSATAVAQAPDEKDDARAAYARLQNAIKVAMSNPDALRIIYNRALDLWDPRFAADASLVRSASPDSLKHLTDTVRAALADDNVMSEKDAFAALDAARG